MIFVENLCLKLLLLSQSVSAFTISQIYGEQILDQWNVFVTGKVIVYKSCSEILLQQNLKFGLILGLLGTFESTIFLYFWLLFWVEFSLD